MERDAIRAKVQELLRDVVDNDEDVIADDNVADHVGNRNRTSHMHMMVAIKEEFPIRFETAEISSPDPVGELVDLIGSKLAA